MCILFIERQNRRLKYFVLRNCKRRTLSSRTPLGYLLTSCPEIFQNIFDLYLVQKRS